MTKNIISIITELKDIINQELAKLPVPDYPKSLYDPLKYSLNTEGKRIRPILTLIVGQGFGATLEQLLPAALAIEILHTYTLVHDDIMDDDDLRRGRETLHKKWNVNTAILSGDAINTLAFNLLMKTDTKNLREVGLEFTQAMLEICEGQALDVEFENRLDVSIDEYLTMITKKTARLLAMSCKLGGLIADCKTETLQELSSFAIKIGQAFQIQDDLLEILSSQEKMGKSLGSDFAAGKKTYPMLLTLETMKSKEKEEFLTFLKNCNNIKEIRDKFIESNSIEKSGAAVKKLMAEAKAHLQVCPPSTQKTLIELTDYIQSRKS